jgi:predicted Zn-dependent protease
MLKKLTRKVGAFFLLYAFLLSVTAVVPLNVSAQKEKDDKVKKQTNASQTDTKKPLSTNENPEMIGKRNINGGGDKFWGWLGGSQEKEIQIGRQLSMEVEQSAKMVEDPMVTEYINRVGQNIVLHSDAKIPFSIKVIDSDEVNAFALPGGFFYVNKGLILAADNESELAGVMAHEIAHVAARHAMENAGKGQFLGYGILAGIIFTGGIAGAVLQNTAGIAQALAFFKFSRGSEEEADRLGVQYLYAAGYDPAGMASMFEKLASQNRKKRSAISQLFSTHPQSLERRDTSLALIARFPEKEEYVISTSEFQRVRNYLLRISNAKANISIDVDDTESNRPTLKRRQPDQDSTNDNPNNNQNNDKEEEPPQLKRRTEPNPTPSPDN